MSDPKIDPERMEQWKANILPVQSAERLKGKGSSPSHCSCEDLRAALVKITQMNCDSKTDIAEMIAEIREIARDAVPDYIERARLLRQNKGDEERR